METKLEKLQKTIEKFENEIEIERETTLAGEKAGHSRHTGFSPWADFI